MKKFLLSVIAATSVLAVVAPVQAQTANFDVNINLTSACAITAPPAAVAFTYVSFQTTASALDAPGSFAVKCTNSLVYTTSLDAAGSYTDAVTNLTYTLALATPAAGTGAAQTYAITGNMPANQVGTCASATCTNGGVGNNKTRTLTVAY